MPVTVLLDDLRSLHNVGAFFRTADAAAIEKLMLSGITGSPPHKEILKTALGAEGTVPWEHRLRIDRRAAASERHYELAIMETTVRSVDLFDWTPRFPVCVVFGNEVDGVAPALRVLRHARPDSDAGAGSIP